MGSKHNSLRSKWQDQSIKEAIRAEKDFVDVFIKLFEDTDYEIISKPKLFKNIYVNIPLSKKEQKEIFDPGKPIDKHGINPDYSIKNKKTNKTLFIEIKRQNGWVENKTRSAGRGNAHERSCKYFTPGLLKILRQEGKLGDDSLPFWTIFVGDITRDPCRVREITCWYDEYTPHFFFWRDTNDPDTLINHFIDKLSNKLE